MFGKKLGLGGLADAAGKLTETVKEAAEGAASTTQIKTKLEEEYGAKLEADQLFTLLKLAGSIPLIGTPFKVLSTILEFAVTLPDQTARVISDTHLKNNKPLIIIPMDKFAMVLSADGDKIECNFYKNDPDVTNHAALQDILSADITRKHIDNQKLGIDRDIFVDMNAINAVAMQAAANGSGDFQKKGEKFIVKTLVSFAIEQSLSQIEGYEYLEYIPGFSYCVDCAIDPIAEGIAEVVVENSDPRPSLSFFAANDR